MTEAQKVFFQFGSFQLDDKGQVLLRDGRPVNLTPKALDTLLVLVRNHGRLVTKEELINAVWPDSFVEEGNLSWCVSVIRKTLNEGCAGHDYIETVPKRGYRFVAPVKKLAEEATAAATEASAETDMTEAQEGSTAPLSADDLFQSRAGQRYSRRFLQFGLILAAVAGVAYYASRHFQSAPPPSGSERPIAVLPFQSLDPHEQEGLLGLGIADSLISKLSNVSQLRVRPTSAIRKYQGSRMESVAVGRELQVGSVLEGSIRREGDRIRVSAQLVDTANGSPIWAGQFDEKFTDIFTIEDSIAEQIARALMLRLERGERAQLAKRYTDSVTAYEAYIGGRFHWNKATEENYWKSTQYFHEAIRQDSHYALAHVGLADCYFELARIGAASPEELLSKSREAAQKALTLDAALAEGHASLARVKVHYDWDWPGAEAEFERALALNPNYPLVHLWYSQYLTAMGRSAESLTESERALELDPLDLRAMVHLGWHYLYARQYDQAIDRLQKTLKMEPDRAFANTFIGLAYLQKGMRSEATSALFRAVTLFKSSPRSEGELGAAFALLGQTEQARQVLKKLFEISKHRYVSPYSVATIYAGLNEKDQAFQWLERAYKNHAFRLVNIKVDPMLDNLHSDARYDDLIRRLGLG